MLSRIAGLPKNWIMNDALRLIEQYFPVTVILPSALLTALVSTGDGNKSFGPGCNIAFVCATAMQAIAKSLFIMILFLSCTA